MRLRLSLIAALLLAGGMISALAYVSQYQTWGATPSAPTADSIEVNATNLATVTINPQRAHVDCNAAVKVKTDGPITVTLTGCARTITAG